MLAAVDHHCRVQHDEWGEVGLEGEPLRGGVGTILGSYVVHKLLDSTGGFKSALAENVKAIWGEFDVVYEEKAVVARMLDFFCSLNRIRSVARLAPKGKKVWAYYRHIVALEPRGE